jgi:hypothetical protein
MGNRKTKSVSAMITYLKLCHQRITAACVLSLAALTIPVKAQVIVDLSVVTCGQYMSKDRDTQDVIAAWMSGYYNAAKKSEYGRLIAFRS